MNSLGNVTGKVIKRLKAKPNVISFLSALEERNFHLIFKSTISYAVCFDYCMLVQATSEPAINTDLKEGSVDDEKSGSIKKVLKNKVTFITAVAKKKPVDVEVKKGELMESNADAMEVKIVYWCTLMQCLNGY